MIRHFRSNILATVVVGMTIFSVACSTTPTETSAPTTVPAPTAVPVPTDEPTPPEPTAAPAPTATPQPTPTTAPTEAATATPEPQQVAEPVLSTECFVSGPGLVLPDNWIASDVPGAGACTFVLQQESRADTTAIAGELFASSSGRSFEAFVEDVEARLAVGQEPDLPVLQLLNSGASGRDLPIIERIELEGPNRATILVHESDRRGGWSAFSAVVDTPLPAGSTATYAFVLWGMLLPLDDWEPSQAINYPLIQDLINSMQIDLTAFTQ